MGDELFLTNYEGALALVASSMKKARQPFLTLLINSFMGGMLFSAGSMLYVLTESYSLEEEQNSVKLILILRSLFFAIGLFYVVITGTDLFNSNILFFTVGLCRRAVTILDMVISLFFSYWLNLVGTIFVSYIFCHYSAVSSDESFVRGSVAIVIEKSSRSFVQTLLRGMAGNFFVSLAIYLQIMAKPLHVKFMCLALPVTTLVSLGFSHSVADMYMLTIGLINHAPVPVSTIAWKVMVSGAIGNIIGGSFFGIVIPWYSHIYVVESDQKELNLPTYDNRDVQPELNADSRVVRQRHPAVDEDDDIIALNEMEKNSANTSEESRNSSSNNDPYTAPQPYYASSNDAASLPISRIRSLPLSRTQTALSAGTRASVGSRRSVASSPKNVFPIYGLPVTSSKEKAIASGASSVIQDDIVDDDDIDSAFTAASYLPDRRESLATYLGAKLRRALTRRLTADKDRTPSPQNSTVSNENNV